MSVTFTLDIFAPPVIPGPGFYSRVSYDPNGTYWDEVSGTLLPLANAQPNIQFLEGPLGTWSWTREFNALPDGFYTVALYDVNDVRISIRHLLLKGGVDSASLERTEIALNADTGGVDALQYITPQGTPISGAAVRVFTNTDWQAQNFADPVGITFTDANGRWADPVFVPAGDTYVIQFHLSQEYGPDTVSVTV